MSDSAPNEPIRNLIATRDLWIRTGEGPARPLKVMLGAPYRKEAPDTYACEYHIEGLRKEPQRGIHGVDPMQALALALFAIGAELYAERELWRRKVWWLDENDPNEDLGFPRLDLHKPKAATRRDAGGPLKTLIATHELWTRDKEGPARPLKVLMWAPYLEEGPDIYVCECHIEGLQKEPMLVRGPDLMRALVSALFTVGSILEAERKVWERRVWARDESDESEDLGFPLSSSDPA